MSRFVLWLTVILTVSSSQLSSQTIWQRSESTAPTYDSFGFCEAPSGDLWDLDSAGIYVSHDRGATWHWMHHGTDQLVGGQLTADAAGTIYAQTYEGLLRSTDNGIHWEFSMPYGYETFGYVTAGPDSMVYLTNEYQGIYASSDHGKSWHMLDTSPVSIVRTRGGLVFSNGVLVGALWCYPEGWRICRSVDRGGTWTNSEEVFSGIEFLVAGPGGTFYAGNKDTLLASSDSGRTWQRMGSVPCNEYNYVLQQAACDGQGRIYIGGSYFNFPEEAMWLAVSEDTGRTWTTTLLQEKPWLWYLLPLRNGVVYAGVDGGIYMTNDHGASWQSLGDGIANRRVNCFASCLDGKEIYAGTDRGVYCSNDDGMNWSRLPLPGSAFGMSGGRVQNVTVNRTGRLYVQLSVTSIISTTDQGTTWKGEPALDTASTSMVLDTAQTLLRGSAWGMLDRSTDDGLTWMPTGFSFPGGVTGLFEDSKDTLFVSTAGGGLFRVSGGQGADAPIGLQGKYIWDFLKHRGGTLIALIFGEGIFRSTDHGTTWVSSNQGISPEFWPQKLAMTRGGEILVSGWSGVLMSSDAGASWHSLGQGLPADSVVSVAVTPSGRIIAGTRSGLFYSTTFLGVSEHRPTGIPTVSSLYQNFPNPFNPSTTICYDLPHDSRVSIVVYDVMGREVRHLVNAVKQAGSHDVHFDAHDLASGIYIYRMQADPVTGGRGFTDVKKLVVLR